MPKSTLDRKACVEIPALPLQILGCRHPEWRDRPLAVVDHDRPQGVILWCSALALKKGVRTGMRYASGLALCGDLAAAEVPAAEIAAARVKLLAHLLSYSPRVEPLGFAPGRPAEDGVFFLDASGLEPLYESLDVWGRAVADGLAAIGFATRVTVGFTRFGTWAGSRGRPRGAVVIRTREEEAAIARRVPLSQIGLVPRVRDALERLGVTTVGAFLDLPIESVRRRFGVEAHEFHRRACAEDFAPVQAAPWRPPVAGRLVLEEPEPNATGLLFLAKRLLHPLLTELAARHEGVAVLRLGLALDDGSKLEERISPASPTLGLARLLELLRLRAETISLRAGIVEIEIALEGAAAPPEQIKLFAAQAARDARAADEALARVRAELGDDAVVRARLVEAHLPEVRFRWERCKRVVPARPSAASAAGLVRRIQDRPTALAPCPKHAPDGWLLRGVDHGSVERFVGPYIVSGGWWVSPVHREYHYAVMRSGDIYWVYYDKERRQWFLHGQVE